MTVIPNRWNRLRIPLTAASLVGLALACAIGMPASAAQPFEIQLAAPAAEHRVFAGRHTEIPLHVRGKPGGLRARWYALASGLRAPLGAPFGLALSPAHGAERKIYIAIPEATRVSTLELDIEVRANNEWARAGRLRLRAYPDDQLQPLRRFARSLAIALRDDAGALTRFFTAERIPIWQDGDGRSTSKPAVIVSTGERASAWIEDRDDTQYVDGVWHLVLAANPHGRLPHVIVKPGPAGGTLVVRMPLVEDLEHDPEAQRTLVEIFTLLNEYRQNQDQR